MSRRTFVSIFILTLALALCTDAFAPQGFTAGSVSVRSMSLGSTKPSAVRLANRKARRMSEEKRKEKKTKGSSRQAKPVSDAKWLQVLDSKPTIEPGCAKVVSGKYKGEELFFALTEYGGTYRAVSEACGRCKFPLINGKVKVVDAEGKTEDVKAGDEPDPEAKLAIACPLCGAMFDLSTGVVAGEQPRGLAQQFVSRLVSQTAADNIKTYEARELSSGAIVVRVD